MNIAVADERGREVQARVYRFHDGYRAQGMNLETGVVDKRWADRLILRVFVSDYDKQIQHNLLMTFNPYGDVTLAELSAGATVRYEKSFGERASVDALAGYAYGRIHYQDLDGCVYDWFGRCLRARAQPGERNGRAEDQRYGDHSAYGRIHADLHLYSQHVLRLSVSPTYTTRTGDELRQAKWQARDPLSAERHLLTFVTGLEYNASLLDDRLENVAFAKVSLQAQRSEDPQASGAFLRRDRQTHRLGLGDALRYTFAPWPRACRPDEIFGNAFPVQPNLELKPELSHNLNLGVTVCARETPVGQLRADVNGFVRDASQLIVLVGNDKTAMYQNVYSARSLGMEAAAGRTSVGDYVALDGNVTHGSCAANEVFGGLGFHVGTLF